ncbi:MAG: hypothetical protein WAK63_17075 [Xanthobacteraceae bacterium]
MASVGSSDSGLGPGGEFGENVFEETPCRLRVSACNLCYDVAPRLHGDEIPRLHSLRYHHKADGEAITVEVDHRGWSVNRNNFGRDCDAHDLVT